VVTPFRADLSPDSARLIAHCKWLIAQNCGLAVFGTNSEANSMAAAERMELLDAVVASGVEPARMMPGTGCCSLTETVALTAHAVRHGCAGVLMLPPFYYKSVSEEGLYRYFSEVVQRVGDARLRVYLYHIPPVAMVGITPGLVERLLKDYPGTIAGMKDSSGDWNNTKTFLEAFSKSGFDIFVGSETFLLENMRHGGAGCISATANVNAAAIHALYARTRQRTTDHGPATADYADAADKDGKLTASPTVERELKGLQAELNAVREVFTKTKWPSMIAALKQAIAIYRDDPEWGRVRPPLTEFTDEQAVALRADLEAIGFTM